MEILEDGIHFESDNTYHLQIEVRNKRLLLYVSLKDEETKINLDFDFALATQENLDICKNLLPLLNAEEMGGFKRLVNWSRSSTKEQVKGIIVKDALLYWNEGQFSSELKVENGRLLYTIKSVIFCCGGSAFFDFGLATRSKVRRIEKAVYLFEQDYLTYFFWKVKDKNINDAFSIENMDDVSGL
ncbi:MAG: hypothetical protein RR313_00230 [Anaerovoracaceae bacterium]